MLEQVHDLGTELSNDLEKVKLDRRQAREQSREETAFRRRIGRNPRSRQKF